MPQLSVSLFALATGANWHIVLGAPAPNFATYNSDPAGIPTKALSVSGLPGATGSLRAGTNLVGYNPSNPVSPGPTSVSSFALAPGQTNSPDLGLYLDLENVQNPQPIRGSTDGPTDPGPRV